MVQSSELAPNTVRFSPSSSALQSFAKTLQQVAPSKLSSHIRSGIDILALDVVALELDTVYVKLESELTRRLENGEGTFFRDHPTSNKGKGKAVNEPPLESALRIALGGLKVIHTGDLFSLPLPPHPVTHVPPNPGEILLCEPVSQGILSADTKIILSRGRIHAPKRSQPTMSSSRSLNDVQEDDEDTSNDQFYSAAEDRDRTDTQTDGFESVTEAESDSGLSQDDEDDLSDDSMDEMISLQAPTLPPTCASGVSTMQPGTPMTIGRGRKTNGMTTPGTMSVYSSFTATTARPDRQRGRLFKANGLMAPIPDDLLHPKPSPEDDEEARVYVDVTSLSKIGCFSGDWVRIEASEEPPANGFGAFGLGSFNHAEPEVSNWRPVRVYSLPESHSRRPMTRIPSSQRHDSRRLSFFESQVQRPASPAAYVSPILQANLDNASYVRLSALKRSYQGKGTLPKFTSASRPPDASEIRIHRIRSPVTIEGAYQTAVLGGMKGFFSRKIRLLRTGDLLAIPIDAHLGKAMQETPGSAGGTQVDDVVALSGTAKGLPGSARVSNVAWFKVDHIQVNKTDDSEDDRWGSVASVDSSSVMLNVSGFETSRIPGTKDNNWEYYLGSKKGAKPLSESTVPSLPEPEAKHVSPVQRQLRELMATATSQKAVHLNMPPVAILLVSNHRDIGKTTVAMAACADIGLHSYTIDCHDILGESGGSGADVKTEAYLSTRADRAIGCGPDSCALLIRHIETLTAERIATSLKDILQKVRVLVATTNEVDKLPDSIRGLFTHELEMRAPDEAEREAILKAVMNDRGVRMDPTVDIGNVALKTAALVAGDLVDVVDRAVIAQQSRLEKLTSEKSNGDTTGKLPISVRDIQVAGGPFSRCLTREDFDNAVDAVRKNFSDAIGAPKIPNVTWSDVGGLTNVKDAVTETIQLPLERPELFAKGMKKRSGILFYGPPGTGKTLLAKAIATEYSLNFLSVKGPELLNMYIGESEANVRRVFQKARDARPSVVFFDELDSVAPKRGNQGDSGGVMDRIVSQLLAELDGMSGGEDDAGGVFVIGATNRPDLLDPALLRPGRFDKLLYLGVSDTREKQVTILEALTRKYVPKPYPPKHPRHLYREKRECKLTHLGSPSTHPWTCPTSLPSSPTPTRERTFMRFAPTRCSRPSRDRRRTSTRACSPSTQHGRRAVSGRSRRRTSSITLPKRRRIFPCLSQRATSLTRRGSWCLVLVPGSWLIMRGSGARLKGRGAETMARRKAKERGREREREKRRMRTKKLAVLMGGRRERERRSSGMGRAMTRGFTRGTSLFVLYFREMTRFAWRLWIVYIEFYSLLSSWDDREAGSRRLVCFVQAVVLLARWCKSTIVQRKPLEPTLDTRIGVSTLCYRPR